jgi:hypothetical protein
LQQFFPERHYLPLLEILATVNQALKAFGQILKSHFILRVIDEPALRMAIERVLNGIEQVHRFTRAMSVGNPREFLRAEKQEQEMAEACKRLIKNCIICRNYLYLSQKLAAMDDPQRREAILNALTHGSAVSWQHVNLLGEYDFSEERLQDTVGIKPPKLVPLLAPRSSTSTTPPSLGFGAPLPGVKKHQWVGRDVGLAKSGRARARSFGCGLRRELRTPSCSVPLW